MKRLGWVFTGYCGLMLVVCLVLIHYQDYGILMYVGAIVLLIPAYWLATSATMQGTEIDKKVSKSLKIPYSLAIWSLSLIAIFGVCRIYSRSNSFAFPLLVMAIIPFGYLIFDFSFHVFWVFRKEKK